MNSIVEEIKSRIDIIDLISEHVDLKKAGQNYKGLCPFHSEKTPSFMASPSKQIFHCFGCNKGGDIFAFVMNYENMTFHEALSYLSRKAGIKSVVNQGAGAKSGLKESLFAIYKEALIFFQNNLKNSKQALSYLKERGINSETIERFSIGFSKHEKDSLFNYLKKQGFQQEHIKASGLVNFNITLNPSSTSEEVYDFFRNRLMFPIFDLQGRAIAFGGRILSPSKNAPKYINSSDSLLFRKGESSYGLNIAKNSISQKGYSIIVEGYFDVVMCHHHNIINAIAPLGTALTLEQIRKLKRFSNKALLIFDGDSAGISATKRSVELCYAEGMIAKILLLPQGEDPDTFLRRHGEEKFRKYMSKALSPVDFLLKIYGKSKLDAVRNMLKLIIVCPDSLQRDETIRELAEKSKINELTIREELKNIIPGEHKTTDKKQKSGKLKYSIPREEKMLLNIALSKPDKADAIVNCIEIQLIEDPVIKSVFEKIKTLIDDGHELSIERLLPVCDEEGQKLITMLSINPEIDEEHIDESMKDCLKIIKIKGIQRQIIFASEAEDLKLLRSLLFEKKKAVGGGIERSI